MKKVFNYLKKQSKIIISFVLGLVVATTVSYGVNQIQSEGVSYTKSDGTTVSVKQALDDLINKSLTRIEFLEKWLSSNTGLSLEQVKNKNEFDYLADVVSVGDYVAYDAGSWTETAAKPTSHGQFGGYTSGQNKANSVAWCYNSGDTTSLKGWRVFSIDNNTKTVALIHAGQPECYYHGTDDNASVANLNNRATSTYLNSNYADSTHMMKKGEADQNILRTTGDRYWLATAASTSGLWGVEFNGNIFNGGSSCHSYGVRPVVVLKSKILTTGKGTDKVGQEAWTLVKP